jgi:hypothetical protein
MNIQAIVDMLEREPFEPFRICLSSGESYRALNPHTVALLKNRLFVALPDSDRSTFVSYMHIAALETLGNGHARRRRRPRR